MRGDVRNSVSVEELKHRKKNLVTYIFYLNLMTCAFAHAPIEHGTEMLRTSRKVDLSLCNIANRHFLDISQNHLRCEYHAPLNNENDVTQLLIIHEAFHVVNLEIGVRVRMPSMPSTQLCARVGGGMTTGSKRNS